MMISHFQHLEREEGEVFGPALVLRGARERLNPILMTAGATGLALVPLVIAGSIPGHEIEHPMAIVILGGLVTSTLLNLLVVPSLYLRFAKPQRSPSDDPAPGAPTGAAAKPKPPTKPDKVVLIVVDALSKEIVEKYDMRNVRALMADGVDTPRGYLGHTGSVTVVSHNVLTSGMLPKHMGWTNEGYRDVDGVLGDPGGLYLTSNFGYDEMSALQKHAGYPHLSDYLDDTGKVFTVSPKGYAAYGLSGPGSDNTSVITFASGTCKGVRWRKPAGPGGAAVHLRAGTPVARATGSSAARATTRCSSRRSSTPRPTTATSWATNRGTRAVTSGPPMPCSTSWTTRRTPGAASSSACPASTRPPTCGAG